MTIRECYAEMGADFNDVISRLPTEKMVKKFAIKFLNDPSYGQLKDAMAAGDYETAFRASHTLKGTCLNLGLTPLAAPSSDLCEVLRPGHEDRRVGADFDALMAAVTAAYEKTADAIGRLDP